MNSRHLLTSGGKGLVGLNLHEAIVWIKNREARGFQYPPYHQDPLTLLFAMNLQLITKTAIKELIEKGLTLLPEIATSPFIKKTSKPVFGLYFKGMEVWHVTQGGQSGTHDRFIVHLLNVLKELGTRLEFCHSPTCRKTFVMQRYDQRYCTKRCRSREAMKEWRQTGVANVSRNIDRSIVNVEQPGIFIESFRQHRNSGFTGCQRQHISKSGHAFRMVGMPHQGFPRAIGLYARSLFIQCKNHLFCHAHDSFRFISAPPCLVPNQPPSPRRAIEELYSVLHHQSLGVP